MLTKQEFVLDKMFEHLAKVYEEYSMSQVVGIFLQGSQNYGLEVYTKEYRSDVDTKVIVLPSLEDIIDNKAPVSKTIILPDNSHCDVKDIRVMFNEFKKQNINFTEILFTRGLILNESYQPYIEELFNAREQIATADIKRLVNSIAGMSEQKFVALKHPYPSLVEKLEKFHYDPKQLHHIYRLNYFIKDLLINHKSFKKCLHPSKVQRKELIEIKKGCQSEEEATLNAERLNKETFQIKNDFLANNSLDINQEAFNLIDKIKKDILIHYFKETIKNEYN